MPEGREETRESGLRRDGELEYFTALWEKRNESPVRHSPEIWDRRAGGWISRLGDDSESAASMRGRVEATARYLRGRGLLAPNDSVVDVGCGPGLFVTEFAQTVRLAAGMDYSGRFIDYARMYAAERGVTNVTFSQCDFLAFDVSKAGLEGAFDLVFTSITPAASGKGCLDKLMSMSRRWCYNASFVSSSDELLSRVSWDVFGEGPRKQIDGRGFYALLNLLWLRGYYPETNYYLEERDETVRPSPELAEEIAARCGRDEPGDAERVLRRLEEIGCTRRRSSYRYGAILWDVTCKESR
jgi:SAM-dependent methyltransferase